MVPTASITIDPLILTTIKTDHCDARTSAGVHIGNQTHQDVAIFGAGGGQGTTLYGQLNAQAVTCTTLTASGLTTGRMTFAAAGGLLTDSADILARTGPFSGTTTEYGAYINLVSSGTRNTVRTLQVDFTQNLVTGSSDAGTAIWANAKSGGGSNFNHFVGVQSYADHAGSGTVSGVYGLNVYLFNSGGGGITSLYGLNIAPPVSMAGVTNAYGVYIGDFTAGKHAIYTGTGIVRLGDRIEAVSNVAKSHALGGTPDGSAGHLEIRDTTATASGVGGRHVFSGKYNSSGDIAYFGEVAGRKANSTDGDYSGILALRAQKGAAPYLHDVLILNGDTDAATFYGGVTCTTLTASGIDTTAVGPAVLSATAVNTAGKTTGLWFGNTAGGSLAGVAAEVITPGVYPSSVGKGRLWAQNGVSTTTAMEWLASGVVNFLATTASTSTTTGCATFAGGIGVAGAVFQAGGQYHYLRGDATTDGSVRVSSPSAGVMTTEARISGTWTEIGRFG
jgi:hypothetical protein